MRLLVIVANVKERKNILNPQNLLFLSLFEASTTAVLSVRCRKNSTHKSLRQNPCHKHMRLQNMIGQLCPPSVPITITPVGGGRWLRCGMETLGAFHDRSNQFGEVLHPTPFDFYETWSIRLSSVRCYSKYFYLTLTLYNILTLKVIGTNRTRGISSDLVYEFTDTVEMSIEENMAATTQNTTESSRGAEHALGKRSWVTGVRVKKHGRYKIYST